MINTIRSEWIKLRTVRMNFVLFVLAVAFPVVVSVLVAALASINDLKVDDVVGLVTGSSVVTALLLGVVGAVSISAEFAHGTIRPTFAATPKRMRVLISKAVVIALFAAVAEALVVVFCYAVSSAIVSSRGAHLSLSDQPEARSALIGIVVFAVIVSLLGFGIGMVIRNTPAAVAVLILWPLVVENIIMAILSAAGVDNPQKFLPYISGFGLGNPNAPTSESLSRVAGGLYFGAVTAVVAMAGALITARRDA
ncbi:MAG: type transport system permease protein [Ilumatobacteraceae bacterium]